MKKLVNTIPGFLLSFLSIHSFHSFLSLLFLLSLSLSHASDIEQFSPYVCPRGHQTAAWNGIDKFLHFDLDISRTTAHTLGYTHSHTHTLGHTHSHTHTLTSLAKQDVKDMMQIQMALDKETFLVGTHTH